MKILEEQYPKGTLPGQRTDGRYIDGYLYENIKVLSKNIIRDMTFLTFICSSTLEVGTGKSVFAQQFAEAYLEEIKQQHNIDNPLSMRNIVFRPQELIKRAFEVPRYSVVILDEWEDAHFWSELGMSLRQFFRKCRQLNLLIICIIPNYFQLPINYAISRSVALVDVKFSGEFQRGYFSFYNFDTKKNLYIFGKKTQNYRVVKPNFSGRFADGYVVDEDEYRRAKYLDMLRAERDEKKPLTEKQVKQRIFVEVSKELEEITVIRLAEAFKISKSTAYSWINGGKEGGVPIPSPDSDDIIINPTHSGIKYKVEPEPEDEE